MSLLEVSSLTKSFGGLMAVSNVDIRIDPGDILGMIGPNGAGKTTVFNLITGIYKPDKGSVQFDSKSLVGKRPHAIAAAGIARTFQTIRLFPALDGDGKRHVGSGLPEPRRCGRGHFPPAVAARGGAGHPRPGRAPHALHERLGVPQRARQEPAVRRSASRRDRPGIWPPDPKAPNPGRAGGRARTSRRAPI